MRVWAKLGAGVLLMIAGTAQAQAVGNWRVNGAIAGRTFVLDCRFDGRGGACVDASSDSKRQQVLTSFSASGDQVAWAFNTKAMLMTIALNFAGKISGDRMSGTMRAAGRNGTFTGVRR